MAVMDTADVVLSGILVVDDVRSGRKIGVSALLVVALLIGFALSANVFFDQDETNQSFIDGQPPSADWRP